MIEDKCSEEALEIWGKMEKQVGKIIRKILHFNSAYEYEDYLQEAYIACHNATLKYDSYIKNRKRTNGNNKTFFINFDNSEKTSIVNMRKDVFAYWYVQKRLFKIAAKAGEVMYNLCNSDGEFIRTISNSEYRKKRKQFHAEGKIINSVNIFKDLDFFNGDESNGNGCQDIVDPNFNGFSPEVQEMLSEDFAKRNQKLY